MCTSVVCLMVLAGVRERDTAFPSCKHTTFASVYSEIVFKHALRNEKNYSKVQMHYSCTSASAFPYIDVVLGACDTTDRLLFPAGTASCL